MKGAIAILGCALWPVLAAAQEEITLELIRPQLGATAQAIGAADLEDDAGRYDSKTLSISALVPIGEASLSPDGPIKLLQYLARADVGVFRPRISSLDRQHAFYSGTLALGGLLASSLANAYLMMGGASLALDDRRASDLDLKPWLFGLGAHRAGERLVLLYGVASSYVDRRAVVLPALGLVWRPSSSWGFSTLLPFQLEAEYSATRTVKLSASLGISGNRFSFVNGDAFPGEPEMVGMRVAQGYFALQASFRLSDSLWLEGQAGVLGGRFLAFSDGEGEFLRHDIEPAGYSRLVARYAFGRSLLDRLGSRTSP
jgi:hypothetical protein